MRIWLLNAIICGFIAGTGFWGLWEGKNAHQQRATMPQIQRTRQKSGGLAANPSHSRGQINVGHPTHFSAKKIIMEFQKNMDLAEDMADNKCVDISVANYKKINLGLPRQSLLRLYPHGSPFCFCGDYMNRYACSSFINSKGETHYYTARENQSRKSLYKAAICCCCWPGCEAVGNLETHHIVMLSAGGSDDYVNFIVLCKDCHSRHQLHRLGIDRQTELLIYKFYKEKLLLGFTSDDYDNEDFEMKLRKILPGLYIPPPKTYMADVSAYCGCPRCCGVWSGCGKTASGHVIQPGDKFLAAPKSIPFGTMIAVPGYNGGLPAPVLDRGGAIDGNKLDCFFDSHSAALKFGRQKLFVKVIE